MVGQPQILRLRRTATSGAGAEYRYYAVVAGGVNNYSNDGRFSATGKPAIFILALAKESGSTWTLGSNYFKIELPAGDTSKANGVVSFAAVPGPVGELDLLYAGDLQGNLWKFKFTGVGKESWTAEGLSAFKSVSTPTPLFVASDADGTRQPITSAPVVAYGPSRGYIVTFGTGKLLETGDLAKPHKAQSYYAAYDNRHGVRAGWYVDFPGVANGERQISGILAAVQSTRAEAMKRGVDTYMVPASNNDWANGWLVYADNDRSRSRTAADTVIMQTGPIALKTTVNSNATDATEFAGGAGKCIRFNGGGFPLAMHGSFRGGAIEFGVTGSTEKRRVVINAVGRARLCDPAKDTTADCKQPP